MNQPAEEFAPNPPAASAPPPPPAPTFSPAVNDPRRKKPLLAALLSLLPGLGQVYVGYYKRGFTNAITAGLLISFMSLEIEPLMPLIGLFLAFFWLYNVVDASRRASLYNQALAGGGKIELPEDFEAPSLGGSLAGGSALILVGLILLSHTLFGVSLDWIEDWWPVAVIGVGGWLVFKAMQERSGGDDRAPE